MFSHTAEYALRAMVCLASQGDRPYTTQQVAASTHVSPGYLAKILQQLARGGLVRAQRGIRGGVMLGRPPQAITLLEVITLVDPIRRLDTCPLGLPSHRHHLCPLHRQLDQAMASLEQHFANISLADLINEDGPVQPFLESPAPRPPPADPAQGPPSP